MVGKKERGKKERKEKEEGRETIVSKEVACLLAERRGGGGKDEHELR